MLNMVMTDYFNASDTDSPVSWK